MTKLSTKHRLRKRQTESIIDHMKQKVDTLRKHPDMEFSSTEIGMLELFPWAKGSRTRTSLIEKDMNGENLLKARIVGEGRQKRYLIKGRNIIKYIEKYGAALMPTT